MTPAISTANALGSPNTPLEAATANVCTVHPLWRLIVTDHASFGTLPARNTALEEANAPPAGAL